MIEMRNITKIFGTLKANDDVTLKIKKGEIHALLGENGAGKSTIMSVLFGLYQPDFGQILINDELADIKNPNDATSLGIGMVHQHFKLVETFTVIDNIILGAEDTKRGFLSYDKARKVIKELVERYKFNINLDSYISDITVGQQQKVEIIKMLYRQSNILIFDEPTAVLTPQEIDELIEIMKSFAKEGKTIILITHKLNEIKRAADRCSILRRGKMIGTVIVEDTSTDKMAEMMVGRPLEYLYKKSKFKPGKSILSVHNLVVGVKDKPAVNGVSFDVRAGEILGICGIDGNGQSELVEAITGLQNIKSGEVTLNGQIITRQSIRKRYEAGLSHIPEDRQKHGLVLDFNLAYNLCLQSYYTKDFQKFGLLNIDHIYEHTEELIKSYDIRSANGAKSSMRSMSGGNQQKAIIARESSRDHNLLVAVQPTRGLDVGAIEYIHNEVIKEREAGKAILLVSFELDEILNLSDRILVIYEGQMIGEFDTKKTNSNELGLYMSGAKRGAVIE